MLCTFSCCASYNVACNRTQCSVPRPARTCCKAAADGGSDGRTNQTVTTRESADATSGSRRITVPIVILRGRSLIHLHDRSALATTCNTAANHTGSTTEDTTCNTTRNGSGGSAAKTTERGKPCTC
jgi:hypothetical protein